MSVDRFSEVFITNKAKLGEFVVYISGVRVPCESVSITMSQWMFPQAVFSFPPDLDLARLGEGDRAHICVFYWDQYYGPKPEYRIIFDGEIMSWSYAKADNQKTIQFTAVGFMFVLTQFFVEYTNNLPSMYSDQMRAAHDPTKPASIYLMDSQIGNNLFTNGFHGNEGIVRPIDYIKNAVLLMRGESTPGRVILDGESLIDVELKKALVLMQFFRNFFTSNHFLGRLQSFGISEDRFGLLRGVVAADKLNTILGEISNTASAQLQKGSIWDFLSYIFKTLFHEIVMITTPTTGIRDIITKPESMFTIPPRCNVIFPSMNTSWQFTEDYWGQPTRTITRPGMPILQLTGKTGNAYMIEAAKWAGMRASSKTRIGDDDPLENAAAGGESSDVAIATVPSLASVITAEEVRRGPVTQNLEVAPLYALVEQLIKTQANETNFDFTQTWCDYHHLKARAAARNGAMSMAFNPYVVPCFPCVIFDDINDRIHLQGYVTSVTHNLSAHGFSTSISVTSMTLLGKDGGDIDSFFIFPDPVLQGALTEGESADSTYRPLFGNAKLTKNKFVADEEITVVEPVSGEIRTSVKNINTGLPKADASYHSHDIIGKAQAKGGLHTLTDLGTRCYKDHDFAMREYCARKVTSLDEYLSIFNSKPKWFSGDRAKKYGLGFPEAPDYFEKGGVPPWKPNTEIDSPWTRAGGGGVGLAEKARKILDRLEGFGLYMGNI